MFSTHADAPLVPSADRRTEGQTKRASARRGGSAAPAYPPRPHSGHPSKEGTAARAGAPFIRLRLAGQAGPL